MLISKGLENMPKSSRGYRYRVCLKHLGPEAIDVRIAVKYSMRKVATEAWLSKSGKAGGEAWYVPFGLGQMLESRCR